MNLSFKVSDKMPLVQRKNFGGGGGGGGVQETKFQSPALYHCCPPDLQPKAMLAQFSYLIIATKHGYNI